MSFAQPKTHPAGRTIGIGAAIAFHIVLVWALASGLGHEVMKAISNAPIETRLVEEIKPPPPPPKVIELPPPPKFAPPPPAFVPPPEVAVPPSPQQPTLTASVSEPPPVSEPVRAPIAAAAPPAPVAQPAPAPAPAPAPVSASVACSNYAQVMGDAGFPREATRLGLEEGSAVVQFVLGPGGEVKDVKVISASHAAFAKGSAKIVGDYKCKGQGRDVTVQVPFAYKSS